MSRPWMPLYIADYLADTAHLRAAESGAYLHLIMHYWLKGGLPDDERQLARIARLSPEEWRDSRDTLAAFFGDNWSHGRIDAELARADEISSKRSAAGKLRHSNSSANAEQEQTKSTHTRDVTVSVEPISQPESSKVERVSRAREPSIRDELETVLSPEMATAVIDHRRTIKAPLTPHGARLLARNLAARGDPDANANLMIERVWRGFKPEWADNDGKRNHHSGNQRGSIIDFAAGFAGVSPERLDSRFGRGDDLRGSGANGGAEGSAYSPGRTIEGRAIAFGKP